MCIYSSSHPYRRWYVAVVLNSGSCSIPKYSISSQKKAAAERRWRRKESSIPKFCPRGVDFTLKHLPYDAQGIFLDRYFQAHFDHVVDLLSPSTSITSSTDLAMPQVLFSVGLGLSSRCLLRRHYSVDRAMTNKQRPCSVTPVVRSHERHC